MKAKIFGQGRDACIYREKVSCSSNPSLDERYPAGEYLFKFTTAPKAKIERDVAPLIGTITNFRDYFLPLGLDTCETVDLDTINVEECDVYQRAVAEDDVTKFIGLYVKYGGEDLDSFFKRDLDEGKRFCTERFLMAIFYHLVTGVKKLLRANIYHCDIAARNVVIERGDAGFKVRLIDFGRSVYGAEASDLANTVRNMQWNDRETPWWLYLAARIRFFENDVVRTYPVREGDEEVIYSLIPHTPDYWDGVISKNKGKIDLYSVTVMIDKLSLDFGIDMGEEAMTIIYAVKNVKFEDAPECFTVLRMMEDGGFNVPLTSF